MNTRLGMVSLTCSLCVFMAGCNRGPAVAPVEGIVTQNGEILVGAMVEFQPDQGTPSYGYTDENGHYELSYQVDRKGALLGEHNVRVTTAGEKTDPVTDVTRQVPETVPVEYSEESDQYYEVVRGKNEIDIAIEGVRKRRGRRGGSSP